MKISFNWLKQYVACDLSPEELAQKLTLAGLEVEEMERIGSDVSGVVAAKVLKVEKHPNADKLRVCQVDDGQAIHHVVCGAPNVAEGQTVPLARLGAKLTGGVEIKPVTLRGIESKGMLCSERELGLSDAHQGILVLDPQKHALGSPFPVSTEPPDTVFEIAVTPNRPDCLSHIGIAREAAAILETTLKRPDVDFPEEGPAAETCVRIEIQAPEACPRYTARVIQGVTIGESPQWLKTRLQAVGIRSINNVVDVTNFVLMETGHPLHAFDYDQVQGQTIVVCTAQEGEVFTTLDDQERKLEAGDLLICDGERPVALAGIMGGLNSEISETTTNILLESAYFDPMTIRRTAKRLGMSTDASQRFERGADPLGTPYAADRAAQLIVQLAGGTVAKGRVDALPSPIVPKTVTLRPARVNHVLGSDLKADEMKSILRRLELDVKGDDPMAVTVPTFRPDLRREIDLIEEVVRLYGFDRIPPKNIMVLPLTDNRNPVTDFVESLRDHLAGQGFYECVHSSMVPRGHAQIEPAVRPVPIQNPLSPETAVLRTRLIPSLLTAVAWNQNRSTSSVRLFEIGKQFQRRPDGGTAEQLALGVLLSGGDDRGAFWKSAQAEWDFYAIKGVLMGLMSRFHLEVQLEAMPHPFFTPDTSVSILLNGKPVGMMGEIGRELRTQWDLALPAFAFEIDVPPLIEAVSQRMAFTPIPKFPAVKRDLALVVDEAIPVATVQATIRSAGGPQCIGAELFDLYQGDQIPQGKKSVAFALAFQSPERTLTDKEIAPLMAAIVQDVTTNFQAELRS